MSGQSLTWSFILTTVRANVLSASLDACRVPDTLQCCAFLFTGGKSEHSRLWELLCLNRQHVHLYFLDSHALHVLITRGALRRSVDTI